LRTECPVSVDVVLVREDIWFRERFDTADICDMSDALEPLRALRVCVEGRLGGRAGEPYEESVFVRVGKGGGGGRMPGGVPEPPSTACVVRRGSEGGGGLLSFFCGLAGITGFFCAGMSGVAFPLLVGGASVFGRPGGGGGGARFPLLLKFFCWLRAAMRSARELN
jgi:hypothetical protein